MESDKSGKIKLTIELEINQPAIDLIKQDVGMMTEMAAQGFDMWRERMRMRGRGSGMGMMMHHGQE